MLAERQSTAQGSGSNYPMCRTTPGGISATRLISWRRPLKSKFVNRENRLWYAIIGVITRARRISTIFLDTQVVEANPS